MVPPDSPPRYRRWILLVLAIYWIALFIGTHVPLGEVEGLPEHSDKGMHFGAYAGLAFLLGLWIGAGRPMRWRHYLAAFGIVAAYGILDELLQIPLESRSGDPYDLLADCIGATIGLAALFAVRTVFGRLSVSLKIDSTQRG